MAFNRNDIIWLLCINIIISEVRGSRQQLWIYEDNSFAPLAQLSLQQGETEHDAQVNWYHNDVSGLPRELTGTDGSVVYRAWGNTLCIEQAAVENIEPVYQPLRYQGQYFDAETGSHFNRFSLNTDSVPGANGHYSF